MTINRRFLLVRRPVGTPVAEDFKLDPQPIPTLDEGQFLIRNHYASLDPAIRGWLDDAPSYMPPVRLGDPVRASTIGVVAESRNDDFPVGQWVMGLNGIEEFSVASAGGFTQPIDPAAVPTVTNYLSLFGAVGQTAYFGFLEVCEPKAGDTVLVTGAAGAVGSLVGQIAKIKGCRVVGIAGGEAKGRWLTEELGFDAAVDYKSPEFKRQLRAAVPDGIDVYFDNTGGAVFEACLFAMKNFGRIACCGALSQYDGAPPPHGPRGIPGLIVTKRLNLRGFVVMDFADQNEKALADLQGWVADGRLKVQEDIIDGLENLPAALIGLLAGENRGKRMVRV